MPGASYITTRGPGIFLLWVIAASAIVALHRNQFQGSRLYCQRLDMHAQ